MDILKWCLTSHGFLLIEFLNKERVKQYGYLSVHSDLVGVYYWGDLRIIDLKTAESIIERHRIFWNENRNIPRAEKTL
jgi:hypothetical protein